MRITMISTAAMALALTACGSGEEAQEAAGEGLSSEMLAAQMQEVDRPQPGQYETSVQITDFTVPGIPPEQVAQMRQIMGRPINSTYCLTPEEAARGYEEMMRESSQGDCTFERFDVSGGKVDAIAQCVGEDGQSGTMTVSGTVRSDGSDMVMTGQQNIEGVGPTQMEMKMTSQRIGECE